MRIAYLDESFTPGYYFIGAALVTPHVADLVTQSLNNLMRLVSQDHPNVFSENDEFRGTQIWNGKGKWKNIGDRYRYSVLIHAMQALSQLEIEIMLQGINRKQQEDRYFLPTPPHELALKYLLEQIDRNFHAKSTAGLVICDATSTPGEDSKYRNLFREWKISGTGGNFPRKLENIVDTLHFVPSHASRMIQAIDMITFVHQRISVTRHPSELEREVMNLLWRHIETRVVVQRIV
jgi:hypothetical protein